MHVRKAIAALILGFIGSLVVTSIWSYYYYIVWLTLPAQLVTWSVFSLLWYYKDEVARSMGRRYAALRAA